MLDARLTSTLTWVAFSLGMLAVAASEQSPPVTLAPEVEKEWQQAVETARPLRVARDRKRLAEQVTALKEEHQLDDEALKALEQAISPTVNEAMPHWEQFIHHVRRPLLRGPAEKALKALRALEKDPADFLSRYVVPYYHRPEQLTPWLDAMKKALPPQKWQTWQAALEKKNRQRHVKARELVAAGMKKLEPAGVYQKAFETLWLELEAIMPEQQEALQPMKAKVDQWAEDYAKRCEAESCLRLDSFTLGSSGWTDAVKRKYYLYWVARTQELEARKKEVLAMLDPSVQERHRAIVAHWEQREQAAMVRARVHLVEMAVLLTDKQRAEVEAVARTLPVDRAENSYVGIEQCWEDWQGDALKRLNAILDDSQERLWAQRVKVWESPRYTEPTEPKPEPLRHPGAGPVDPAEIEVVISEHLAEGSRQEEAIAKPGVMRRVEEVVRLLKLDEAARSELELAAKGTLQNRAESQRVNMGSYVRSQARGATPETVRQRLAGIGRISFSNRSNEKTLLEQSIENLLDEAQKKTLLAHEEVMRQRLDQCVIGLIMARLERPLLLAKEQGEALKKQLQRVMVTYGPDMARTFVSWGDRAPWFLQSYYLMVPCFGVEEKVLKELFNERQLSRWQELSGRAGAHYWQEIQRAHEARKQSKTTDNSEVFFE